MHRRLASLSPNVPPSFGPILVAHINLSVHLVHPQPLIRRSKLPLSSFFCLHPPLSKHLLSFLARTHHMVFFLSRVGPNIPSLWRWRKVRIHSQLATFVSFSASTIRFNNFSLQRVLITTVTDLSLSIAPYPNSLHSLYPLLPTFLYLSVRVSHRLHSTFHVCTFIIFLVFFFFFASTKYSFPIIFRFRFVYFPLFVFECISISPPTFSTISSWFPFISPVSKCKNGQSHLVYIIIGGIQIRTRAM